jgi:dolichol-phosphate mannosyltransferase
MAQDSLQVSICSPVHNEEANIPRLVGEIGAVARRAFGDAWEQVLVDDGSADRSAALIEEASRADPAVRLIRHERNLGERAAWKTAFAHARGEIVVLLAADLQNDPEDIPRLVERVARGEADCCTGYRRQRKDGAYYWAATRILNGFMRAAFGVRVRDVSSSFFAVRRRFVDDLELVENDHRYILALFAQRGAQLVEIPTAHRGREAGASHYTRWKVLWAVPEVARFGWRFHRGFYAR